MKRREFLTLAGAAALSGVASPYVAAQEASWPNKPVKIIVPYAPGGASDIIARPWADKLSQAFGQQFVIDNRGGAGGMIGTEAAAKSAPDGYTLADDAERSADDHSEPASGALRSRRAISSRSAASAISSAVSSSIPSVGPKTFAEMVDYAKKNPGKLNYRLRRVSRTGTHMRLEMLKYKTGVDIVHVPYRGSADALNDLLPGNIQMMNEINVLPHVKAGKLILLNINYGKRSPDFPDTPTLTELGVPAPTSRSGTAPSRRRARRRASSTSSMPRCGRSARPTT